MAAPQISREPLFITGIEVVDYKRISAIKLDIDPKQNLITIGGANAAGKSSLIDAIASALMPLTRDTTKPIRDGAPYAAIRLTVPPFEIRRSFDPSGKPHLKVIRVADEAQIDNPKAFLEQLLGGFANLDFLTAQPIEQRRILMRLAGIDTSAIDSQIEQAKQAQKQKEQIQAELKARSDAMPWYDNVPAEELSIAELSANLQEVVHANAANQRRRQELEYKRRDCDVARKAAETAHLEVVELERRLAEARERAKCAEEQLRLAEEVYNAEKEVVEQLQDVDTKRLENAIAEIEETNRKVRENKLKEDAVKKWEQAERELGEQHSLVQRLEAEKRRMLAAAQYPVEGLGFDETQVTYNGVPFKQASQAEQIRIAVSIALQERGPLAPILIRNASLMDAKMLALIAEEAKRQGSQVFAEIVANRTEVGYDRDCVITIEEGAGAIGVAHGLQIKADGLSATVGHGKAYVHGLLVRLSSDVSLDLAPNANNTIWLQRDGSVEVRQDEVEPKLALKLGSVMTTTDQVLRIEQPVTYSLRGDVQ